MESEVVEIPNELKKVDRFGFFEEDQIRSMYHSDSMTVRACV